MPWHPSHGPFHAGFCRACGTVSGMTKDEAEPCPGGRPPFPPRNSKVVEQRPGRIPCGPLTSKTREDKDEVDRGVGL